MYQLKKGQEAFMPVEGPLAGRKFVPGQNYAEIPPNEARRFTEIHPAAPAAEVKPPAKADSKKAAVNTGTDLKSVPTTDGGKS